MRALEKKVRLVFKSSGNFLSNNHKNIIILWKNVWESLGQRCLPHPKKQKTTEIYLYLDKNVCFSTRSLLASRSHPKMCEAYIIKWTTSGEPPVGLKIQQDSKWGHSWTIHYITNWLPPCIFAQKCVRYKGISEYFLGWNLILSNLCFLGCTGKMLRLWVKHQFLKKKYFQNAAWDQSFRVRVANFEPLYLRHFWVKMQSFCAH